MTRELVLRNRQRARSVDLRLLRRIGLHLLDEIFQVEQFELGVHLVGAGEMTKLNRDFLGHAGSTDVITFDYAEKVGQESRLPRQGTAQQKRRGARFIKSTDRFAMDKRDACPTLLHGEIFISLDAAVLQARQFHTTWQSELVRYLIHGLLHLCGYDDLKPAARREMKCEENRVLRELAKHISFATL